MESRVCPEYWILPSKGEMKWPAISQQISAIRDGEKFNQYWKLAPAATEYGARLLVRQRNPTVLQGEPHQVIVVFEFESVEAAKRWYESPEYQTAVDSWVESVEGWAMIAGEVLGLDSLNPSNL